MRFYGCTLLALSCLVAFSTSTPVPVAPIRILAANGTEGAPSNLALLNSAKSQDFIAALRSLVTTFLEESDIKANPLFYELVSNLRPRLKELWKKPEVLQVAEDLKQLGVDVDYANEFMDLVEALEKFANNKL